MEILIYSIIFFSGFAFTIGIGVLTYVQLKYKDYENELLKYLEDAYEIVYLEDLTVYVSSRVIISIEDSEFIQLSNKLISIFKTRVGPFRFWFYKKFLFMKEKYLLEYIVLYFTQKIYQDVISVVIGGVTDVRTNDISQKQNLG